MKKNEMLASAGIFAVVIVVAILLFWPKPGNVGRAAIADSPGPVVQKRRDVPVIISMPELISYKGGNITRHIAKQFGPEAKTVIEENRQCAAVFLVKASIVIFAIEIITYKEMVMFVNFTLDKGVSELDQILGALAIPVPEQELAEQSRKDNRLNKYAGFDEIIIARESIPSGDCFKPVGP